jgi:hypothetical protein
MLQYSHSATFSLLLNHYPEPYQVNGWLEHQMASGARPRPPVDGIDQAEEQIVSDAISTLRTLRTETQSAQTEIEHRTEVARGIVTSINATSFMTWADRYDDQIFVISELQNLAYHEVDGGGIQDIATWCIRQYLHIVNQAGEDSIEALSGTIDFIPDGCS